MGIEATRRRGYSLLECSSNLWHRVSSDPTARTKRSKDDLILVIASNRYQESREGKNGTKVSLGVSVFGRRSELDEYPLKGTYPVTILVA